MLLQTLCGKSKKEWNTDAFVDVNLVVNLLFADSFRDDFESFYQVLENTPFLLNRKNKGSAEGAGSDEK